LQSIDSRFIQNLVRASGVRACYLVPARPDRSQSLIQKLRWFRRLLVVLQFAGFGGEIARAPSSRRQPCKRRAPVAGQFCPRPVSSRGCSSGRDIERRRQAEPTTGPATLPVACTTRFGNPSGCGLAMDFVDRRRIRREPPPSARGTIIDLGDGVSWVSKVSCLIDFHQIKELPFRSCCTNDCDIIEGS
jgi:hypothetical protein